MTEQTRRAEIATKAVVHQRRGTDAVRVRRDIPYAAPEGETLTIDVYYPPDLKSGARIAAVLFVIGYSDVGMQRVVGCKAKEMESYISWATLVAASGLIGITCTVKRPAEDVRTVFDYVRDHAETLGIDDTRIGAWSCSGNVPNALSLLIEEGANVTCAVLLYGYMLDLDRSTAVADAAAIFRFVNPAAGKSV